MGTGKPCHVTCRVRMRAGLAFPCASVSVDRARSPPRTPPPSLLSSSSTSTHTHHTTAAWPPLSPHPSSLSPPLLPAARPRLRPPQQPITATQRSTPVARTTPPTQLDTPTRPNRNSYLKRYGHRPALVIVVFVGRGQQEARGDRRCTRSRRWPSFVRVCNHCLPHQ